MHIRGEVSCHTPVQLDGRIEGTFSGGQLDIAECAELKGRVEAETIICYGRIEGQVKTSSLDLRSTGRHQGTVETGELKVELGAVLDCALQSGCSRRSAPMPAVEVVKSENQPSLAEVADVFDEEERPCCIDVPGSEKLELYNHLLNLLEKGKPLVKIIGEPGSGKTVFAVKLCNDLDRNFFVLQLSNRVGSVTSILSEVAEGLGFELGEKTKNQTELLSDITNCLSVCRQAKKKVLLIIDDAEEMYPATMEGVIRQLTGNFAEESEYLQMVLFGSAEMENKMVATIHDYFEDETNCQLCLEPLSIKDTAEYLRFCLKLSHHEDEAFVAGLFPYETIKALHHESKGNIREINRLAAGALRSAREDDAAVIAPYFVRA